MADTVRRTAIAVLDALLERPLVTLLLLVACTLLFAAAAATAYFLLPPSTAHRLLRARGPRRWVRVVRSFWQRRAAGLLAWPHVIVRWKQRGSTVPAGRDAEVVARLGGATLHHYGRATAATRPPVLLVHALVTHPWILDLSPGRSLVGHLLDRGHDVFLLSWGDPTDRGALRGLSHAVQLLGAADAAVAQRTGRQVHVVAYCSGGIVALLRQSMARAPWVASLSLVAVPVDLQVPGGVFSVVSHPELRPAWVLDGNGRVPAAVVREVFHLQRRIAIRSALARRRLEGEEARAYDALDRWLFDQRDLEGGVFFDLVDLARANLLVEGGRIDGAAVDLSRVDVPCLVALADRDHLVPAGSSLVARHVLPDATLLDVPAGHVGMLASSRSTSLLYDPLSDWIASVDPAATDHFVRDSERRAPDRGSRRRR